MKICVFQKGGTYRLGVKRGDSLVDVAEALRVAPREGICAEPMALIRAGAAGARELEAYVSSLPDGETSFVVDPASVEWGPCVPEPAKIVCVGLNYRRHADESGLPYPETPLLFNKFSNALAAHGQRIPIPKTTEQLDYEVELGIVIGRRAADVSEEDALDYVFGYCPANDVSARDLQMRTSQWMLGKTSDRFCPIGPYLVTADEVRDPQRLTLQTFVNGERRQHSSTSDMIFTCREIVSYISKYMTLEPGDLILTGTPEGVALGMPSDRRTYLKPGDIVTVEIEGLGQLTNTFL